MRVAITANCVYCARKFDALTTDPRLGRYLACEDQARKLCCQYCQCDYCGHGHVTEEDFAICEESFQDGTPDSKYFDEGYDNGFQEYYYPASGGLVVSARG